MDLFKALRQRDVHTVKQLLKHGANVNDVWILNEEDEEEDTPLHLAAKESDEKIVKLLIEYGANVNARTKSGKTPLHDAAFSGSSTTVEQLLKHGANVNDVWISYHEGECTPLHLAVDRCDENIVELLIEYGADTHLKNACGDTALGIAVQTTASSLIQLLLENSDINHDLPPIDELDDLLFMQGCATIQNHLIKMETANLYINRDVKELVYTLKNENRGSVAFRGACEAELSILKRKKVGNSNLSFFHILSETADQLAMWLKNDNIQETLELKIHEKEFPIYSGMIEYRYREGKKRKELLELTYRHFFVIFPEVLYDCSRNIFHYLSNKDLKAFVDAFEINNAEKDPVFATVIQNSL